MLLPLAAEASQRPVEHAQAIAAVDRIPLSESMKTLPGRSVWDDVLWE